MLSPELTGIHERLNEDLEFFAEHAPLVIKDKQGNLIPWRLNTAQRYTHARLEEQRRKTGGWVRALVLKGRQQGESTYIEGRFYHQTSRSTGKSTFILSHEGKTTDKLFDMVRRFHDNVQPALQPVVDKSNTRQLTFPGLHADYSAGTAGNEQVGRGGTAQLFHGSEAAFWENAYAIRDGALKSIALMPGTEIILESTANGPVGFFYEKCKAALRGEGDYILIFIPWFWQAEYEREATPGDALTAEEEAFVAFYFDKPFPFHASPPTRAQALRKMLWRRAEILNSSPNNSEVGAAAFRRDYPSNPVEAFLSTSVGEIRADAIVRARAMDQRVDLDVMMPRIGGFDPAGESATADRSILAIRQGSVFEKAYRFAGLDSMQLVARLARLIDKEKLDMLFVDNGYGKGIVDRLAELGFKRRVIGVWFNQGADEPERFTNKRSEILLTAADWVNAGGVSLPNGPEVELDAHSWLCSGDQVHADLAILPMHRETSDGKHQVVPREELIKLFGMSLDIFSAFGLTFAHPVRKALTAAGFNNGWRKAEGSAMMPGRNTGGALKSLARKRAGYGA